ncbi:hypothetical protein LSAT2_012510 [Lamellibrachia satsuma]|nr:hypothetical protein LSAT2_012510 [Lamellibrachia satsuma]
MNDMVETAVRHCIACQCTYNGNPYLESMQISDMPPAAWKHLSMDFLGPLPSGEELMVLVDEYSRYLIVEIIRSLSANTVIPVLDKILAMFGIPVVKSDNWAPFNYDAFASFAKHSGFRHRRVTECWPRGNAQAEGFNKPLTKAIRSAVLEQNNWKQEMYEFLRQYRATPHTSTKFISTNLTAAASVIDRDTVKCDQELCDAKTEYCDTLIDVCTSCELPCSRTTVSDTNLCKTLCAGVVYVGLAVVGVVVLVGVVVVVVRVRRSRTRNRKRRPQRRSPAPIYKGLSKIDTPGSSIVTDEVDTAASHLNSMVTEEVDSATSCRPSIVANSGDADLDQ